jgi:hypothetical protein
MKPTRFGGRPLHASACSMLMVIVGTALVALAGTVASPVQAAVTRHAIFFGSQGSACCLWEASPDGSNARLLGGEAWSQPALSPNGRIMAFEKSSDRTLRIADVTGGPSALVRTAPEYQELRSPRFSPDGNKLLYQDFWWSGEDSMDTVNLDGTEPQLLASHLAYHGLGGYSPDGSKIVFVKKAAPGTWTGEPEVYTANANGSSPTALTNWEVAEDPIEPEYSPDGTKIVFAAIPPEEREEYTYQLFTINADGTGIQQLTSGELYATNPHWAPDGSKIVYSRWGSGVEEELYQLNPDGSGEPERFEPLIEWSTEVAFSPPGSTVHVSDDEYLGATFEPQLYFDSTEKWRPLNVASFMTEEDPEDPGHSYNKLCTELGCNDIPPAEWQAAMSADAEDTPHLKTGKLAEHEYPTSPNVECYGEVYEDCDSGPRAAMYYHVVPSANEGEKTDAGYNYVDYWAFYRYNQDQNDPGSLDDHQGDWEGLTLAPSVTDPEIFDFAIFAQHNYESVYAPENLQCDQGGEESCGSSTFPGGQRVWDFVAVGTHAAYPGVDEGGFTGICTQAQSDLQEGCHNGKAPWSANYEPTDLLAFPPTHESNWVDWPGTWGEDTGTLPGLGKSPDSPGVQERFKCPWHAYSGDPTACPSSIQHSPAAFREAVASACGNWFGGMVVMTVCSPGALRHAVRTARVGHRGTLRIVLNKKGDHTASLRGVAQAIGTPLHVGQTVAVAGRSPGDTELFVRAQDHNRLTQAVFRGLGLEHGGRGRLTVLAGRDGPLVIWITPNGKRLQAAQTHVTKLAASKATQGRGIVRRPARLVATAHRRPSIARMKDERRACRRAMMIYVHELIEKRRARNPFSPSNKPRPGAECTVRG